MAKLQSVLHNMGMVKPKGDHKRKAVAIAPATVTVRDGEIVVVVPDVLGKNASHKQSKNGGRRISEQTEAYRESMAAGALRAGYGYLKTWGEHGKPQVPASDGAWRLEVIGVWPTQHGKIKGRPVGFVCPVGDADAAIPQALDALQHAGILDDDARVVEVRAWNLYRRGVRATVMRLTRVHAPEPDYLPERDSAIVHLLPLVPPAVEPPPKPARRRLTLHQAIPVGSRVRGRSAQMGRVAGPGREGFVCVLWDEAKHQLQVRVDALEVVA